MNKKGLYTQSLRSYSSWIMFGKEYWPIFTFTVTQQVIFVFARTANLCSLLPSYRVKKRRIYGEPAVLFFLAVAHILLQLPPLTDTFHQNTPPGETSWSTSSSSITGGILALFFTFKVRLLHLCSFNSSPGPGACAAW